MNHPVQIVTETLRSAYDEQYTDAMTEWREIGGKYKASNIVSVCAGNTFSKVLECGAGEGSILKYLDKSKHFNELYAIEISDSGITQIRKRNLKSLKEMKKFNGYEIPYPDKHFELTYCSHVIEHVEHPRLLLREIKRVSEFQVFEVPLDYCVSIDRDVQTFLSYGHINVYTPSLFKFLLKSEGYVILEEKLTNITEEVVRFNWYKNMGRKETIYNNFKIKMIPVRNVLRRIFYGKRRFDEYGYSAYTCLAKGCGELKIF